MTPLCRIRLPENLGRALMLLASSEHDRAGLDDKEFRARTADTLDALVCEGVTMWTKAFVRPDEEGLARLISERPIPELGPCDTTVEVRLPKALIDEIETLSGSYRQPLYPNGRKMADRLLAECIAFWLPTAIYFNDIEDRTRLNPRRKCEIPRPDEYDPTVRMLLRSDWQQK